MRVVEGVFDDFEISIGKVLDVSVEDLNTEVNG